MLVKILPSLLFFLTFSLNIVEVLIFTPTTAPPTLKEECTLNFLYGIKQENINAQLGVTQPHQILDRYGEVEVTRVVHKKTYAWNPRFIELIADYPDKGLLFSFNNRNLKKQDFRLRKIIIKDNCKCRSKEGIGIGSTLKEVHRAFEKLEIFVDEEVEPYRGEHYSPRYSFYIAGGEIYINFFEGGSKGIDGSPLVKEIEMRHSL